MRSVSLLALSLTSLTFLSCHSVLLAVLYSFQMCIRRFRAVQHSSETLRVREEANIDLLHLAQDFVEAATGYGKIIISEHFLPPEKKTIQPQSLPGIIGGEKFVVHNILFKFAIDHKNIYGSDFSAAKAAGNELRGLMCYFNSSISDIHVPLMALVDYRGFRLTAMALLPVDTSTIMYGTFDAGKHIHYTQDDAFNERMRAASETLRLRPHRCRQQQNQQQHRASLGFGPAGAGIAPQHVPPGFEGFSLYERERTPLLSQQTRPDKRVKNKVLSHGATEELQLMMQGKLTKSSIDGNELISSGSSVSTLSSGGTSYDDATLLLNSPASPPSNGMSPSSSSSGSQLNMNVSFNNQLIYSAVDLEGHKGLDGKYYLLDFSRVLPPESPNRRFQNPHLSRLLRPEFLKMYDKMLCSDAFSGFIQGTPDEEEINADVNEATRYLLETHIPKMSRRIFEMMREAKISKPLHKFRLTEALHSVGINCRYAGMLRKHITDEQCSTFVLAEVVARSIKNNLRWRLREQHQILKLPLEEPYLRLVIDYLNLVFGNTPKSDEYWDQLLKKDVAYNFEGTFTEEEESPTWQLKRRLPETNPPLSSTPQPNKSCSKPSTTSPDSTTLEDILDASHDSRVSLPRDHTLAQSDGSQGSQVRRQDSPKHQGLRREPGSRDFRSSASPISPVHHSSRRMSRLSVDYTHSGIPGSDDGNSSSSDSMTAETSSNSSSGSGIYGLGRSLFYMIRGGISKPQPVPHGVDDCNNDNVMTRTTNTNLHLGKNAAKLDHDFLDMVFERVRAMVGLQFTHDRNYGWEMEEPFNDTDLKNVGYKVKHMNIISHVQGFFWQLNGLMARSSNVAGLAKSYYEAAIDKYEEALDLNPENKDVLRNLALTWLLLIDEDKKDELSFSDWRVQKVREYIMRAISAPPKYDSLSLFRYANLLSRSGIKDEAEDYYLQSLEADPNNTGCLHEYGEFLSQQNEDDEAEQFYRRSSETTAGAQRFPENFY